MVDSLAATGFFVTFGSIGSYIGDDVFATFDSAGTYRRRRFRDVWNNRQLGDDVFATFCSTGSQATTFFETFDRAGSLATTFDRNRRLGDDDAINVLCALCNLCGQGTTTLIKYIAQHCFVDCFSIITRNGFVHETRYMWSYSVQQFCSHQTQRPKKKRCR